MTNKIGDIACIRLQCVCYRKTFGMYKLLRKTHHGASQDLEATENNGLVSTEETVVEVSYFSEHCNEQRKKTIVYM